MKTSEKKTGTPRDRKVLMPKGCDLHYEVELAVVLKKRVDEWKGQLKDLEDIVDGYRVGKFRTSSSAKLPRRGEGGGLIIGISSNRHDCPQPANRCKGERPPLVSSEGPKNLLPTLKVYPLQPNPGPA